ncbi:pyrimidine-nucleoside phosphorylase [Sporolactobacillus laevolacticus]|uniref:Pyrimidine-nucleoside phosphorylase n=1 Tax=Sporolactobacillus laevolacticus DSM 442 TaxID=1395513 RepID=V6J573_9BACL|nr:pyrimidine-nucleoside phosphorylase [Sporolactobacillus laevolacticus]EST11869.1 pyrimidine-nucleoside phosphorylase [Sporolactobacillus laevolacticus DSM 442]
MRMVDIITKKRDGYALSPEEIRFFIEGYVSGSIPDYQASALAMAIYFKDMTDVEIAELTRAMIDSGETVDLSAITGVKVDKHSTGGVGDTTTLVLAPLVASVGVPVAKMSGRGLGFTGGTIDKLESIAGFSVEMTSDHFVQLVNRDQIAVIGQTGDLVPADKKLYALRDVSGSVESIPLIASSIMSKKIAAGADAIVLEVTCGSGAFMKKEEDAIRLAETMVQIGTHVGRKTAAVITDMSQPLGFAIGNALEVKEAIDTLQGHGPNDLEELVFALGSRMVLLAGKAENLEDARGQLEQALAQGKAFAKFKQFIENQGGDPAIADHPEQLPRAKYQIDLLAKESGVVAELRADQIGLAAMLLGAGRATKEDSINHAAGIVLCKKVGDRVAKGEPLLTIHSDSKDVSRIEETLYHHIKIAQHADRPQLIHRIIS